MDEPIRHHCDLPDDAVADCVFEVVGYFDREGEMRYSSRIDGHSRISNVVGLTHMALFNHMVENQEESRE